MKNEESFVVAIDGPSGSGKGSLALNVARELGFHLLDSGAVSRLLALKALQQGVDLDDAQQVAGLIDDLDIRFEPGEELSIPYLDGVDVSAELRQEATGSGSVSLIVLKRASHS